MFNEKGMALSGSMVMATAVLLGALGIISLSELQRREVSEATFRSRVISLRNELIAATSDQTAWTLSKKYFKNSALACLNLKTCLDQQGGPFTLLDSQGKIIFDSLEAKNGYDLEGQPCYSFSSAGNDDCPLRVQISWKASCQNALSPGSCAQPEELISINFTYKPEHHRRFAFKEKNYDLEDIPRVSLNMDLPSLRCAENNGFFIGNHSFNGFTADANGCVPLLALRGPQGPPGPPGGGPGGPPPPPPPPPPKGCQPIPQLLSGHNVSYGSAYKYGLPDVAACMKHCQTVNPPGTKFHCEWQDIVGPGVTNTICWSGALQFGVGGGQPMPTSAGCSTFPTAGAQILACIYSCQ